MIGMRNILTHQYDSVKLDLIWEVVETDTPNLIEMRTPLIPPEKPANSEFWRSMTLASRNRP